jgi:hypothetical protein
MRSSYSKWSDYRKKRNGPDDSNDDGTDGLNRNVRALASDFVVLVLSEAVLSETVLVLDGCLNLGDADR